MLSGRFRLSTVFVYITMIAALLAFWRLKPLGEYLHPIPFEFLFFLVAIMLFTMALMLQGFRRKP
jgi:hypothetical protein